MDLMKGITGFVGAGEISHVDAGRFRSVCYQIVRSLGGRVCEFKGSSQTPNFHMAVLSIHSEMLAVVCNSTYPIVAFADPPGQGDVVLGFRDHPGLKSEFSSYPEFKYLTKSELELPFANADLSHLSKHEIKQLQYWKPKTLGQVVYNWWD